MAGKSNRGRARKASQQSAANSSEQSGSSDATSNGSSSVLQASVDTSLSESNDTKLELNDQDNAPNQLPTKEVGVHLYPVPVKTQGGEKLDLQLSPGDSVLDVRQFLLEAPETCYFTCYDLLLHTKDGSVHHLEDYNEISEVADITNGSCHLEMVAALYDDRSIRAHVYRTRELLSLTTLHSSLSTVLALKHEASKSASHDLGDMVKPQVPELESLGFMQNIADSLPDLLSSPSKDVKCIESVVFSSFNPPPSHRRLSGDLIYLDVATLEGNQHCITGTTTAFYVNSSTGNVLDPKPHKASFEATTFVGLLQKISPKFRKGFREVSESKASTHPFENVQCLLPPNSWLNQYPVPDHRRDAARAESSLTLSFGSELIGMQRDWNEELQSCREFPHATPEERILRDRALHKVTSDFVDAATSGAIGVINRCIPPINPTDPECFHMYVHNNIFFSFAVDSDLEHLPRKHSSEENSKVQSTLPTQKSGKSENNEEQGAFKASNVDNSAASNTDAINDTEAQSPDVPAESQLAESEQATYASANNDLKGTKAYQEADVLGLYNLAMAIIDYRGHRVVAQSVLPGILQGDKSDSLLYGSVDNGKKICWSEDFHSKVLEAAKRLHLKEHTVLDASGNAVRLAAPVECKGIVGSDDRHYLLDLMRATPRDANYTGPGSRLYILRPELITSFCQAERAKGSQEPSNSDQEHPAYASSNLNRAEDVVKAEENVVEIQDAEKGAKQNYENVSNPKIEDPDKVILFNPNVFTEFKLAGNPEEIASDEELVRKASLYLKDVVLLKFMQDLCTLEVSPMDGQTLTEALHAHGINVRYIGKVAEGTNHMPHLWDLCTNEIAVRSAKHIIKVADSLINAHSHVICLCIAS